MAKTMVAETILRTNPREAFHDDAVRVMACFTEVEYVYDADRAGHAAYVQLWPRWAFRNKYRIWFLKPFFVGSRLTQAGVILHECSHLYIGTEDHAYVQEKHFFTLHDEEWRTNADTFVEYIKNVSDI